MAGAEPADVSRVGHAPLSDVPAILRRALRALLPAWLVLLVAVVVLGELVVHLDSGVVLRAVDEPVDRELQPAGRTPHAIAAVVTWLGAQPVVVVLVIIFAAGLYRLRADLAAALVVVVAGADALTTIAKLVVQRSGPAHRLTSGLHDYAFPSGHTTAASALLVGAALLVHRGNPRPGRAGPVLVGLAGAVAVAVACSRLVLDVHWLSDVCAGLLVGTTWAVLVTRAWPVSPSDPDYRTAFPLAPPRRPL